MKLILVLSILLSTLVSCNNSSSSPTPPVPQPPRPMFTVADTPPATEPDPCKKTHLPSGLKLKYCTYGFQNASRPRNIIYFLHGLNGRPKDLGALLSEFSPFYELISQIKDKAPLFVSLSFGPRETIPFEAAGTDPVSLRELLDVAIPAIERETIEDAAQQPARHLVGVSLGAFNALNAAALRPDYFQSVAAICPALIDFNPFEQAQVDSYILRGSPWVQAALVNDMVTTIRTKYENFDTWILRNPIQQMRSGKYKNMPLFVSIGIQDQYGFFEGTEALAAAAQGKTMNFTYIPADGGHCMADFGSLTDFIESVLR